MGKDEVGCIDWITQQTIERQTERGNGSEILV